MTGCLFKIIWILRHTTAERLRTAECPKMSRKTGNASCRTKFLRHSVVLSLAIVLLRKVSIDNWKPSKDGVFDEKPSKTRLDVWIFCWKEKKKGVIRKMFFVATVDFRQFSAYEKWMPLEKNKTAFFSSDFSDSSLRYTNKSNFPLQSHNNNSQKLIFLSRQIRFGMKSDWKPAVKCNVLWA